MLVNVNMAAVSGLVLYYHPYSFYSQKVMMTMYEKQLDFSPVVINIVRGKQYSSEYLKMNPRGEVPVLQDNGKIIPDSTRIIDYLEDNFSNGNSRLLPIGDGTETRRKVEYFRRIIDTLPVGAVTMGSFFHPELCDKQKLPFLKPVRKVLKNGEINSVNNLRKYAEKNPEVKDVLLKKAKIQEEKHNLIIDKNEYIKILDVVGNVLDKVEHELTNNTADAWLCSEDFTIADVSLTILLVRLDILGLDGYFWKNNRRRRIEEYYCKAQQRQSFKKTIPDLCSHLKILATSQSPITVSIGIIGTIGFVTFITMLFKRIM